MLGRPRGARCRGGLMVGTARGMRVRWW
uniref:Uncharacterized protein n=1 Tax=Arundo donax TaxID=35708 RepID=A0A0A8YY10_ARUDO